MNITEFVYGVKNGFGSCQDQINCNSNIEADKTVEPHLNS